MAVLTESMVRQLLRTEPMTELSIDPKTILTPSAKSFLNERGITLNMKDEQGGLMLSSKETVEEANFSPKIETDSGRLLKIKWQLFKVEVVKAQREAVVSNATEIVKKLSRALTVVNQLIASFETSEIIKVTILPVISPTFLEKEEITYKLSELSLSLVSLSFHAQELEILTNQYITDGFGNTTRSDLQEACRCLSTYLSEL